MARPDGLLYSQAMPKGVYPHTHNKPKTYPAGLVEAVRYLYLNQQMTQEEISKHLGVGRKVIRALMRNHGIPSRAAVPRDQRGIRNGNWQGDKASYNALHSRVTRKRGPASDHACQGCGTRDKRRSWANLTGCYEDTKDYASMCDPCHREYDRTRRTTSGDLTTPEMLRR